jgi:small subunit ribosomal protein S9
VTDSEPQASDTNPPSETPPVPPADPAAAAQPAPTPDSTPTTEPVLTPAPAAVTPPAPPAEATPAETPTQPVAAETSPQAPVAEPPAAVTPATQPEPTTAPPAGQGVIWGTGRRKSAIARVRLIPGEGEILINKREVEKYFTELEDQAAVSAPLDVTDTRKQWKVLVNVSGGGPTGQSGAIRLGVARALVKADARHEPTLRDAGYLTRDARRVERKKYGQRKARRRFQFSKR